MIELNGRLMMWQADGTPRWVCGLGRRAAEAAAQLMMQT